MNILHIIPSLRKGGAERLVIDICTELNTRDNVNTKLITLSNENLYKDLTTKLDYQVIPSHVTPSISSKTKIDVVDFEKVVQSFKPDIIHSHLFEAEMVSRFKLFEGVKYFTHCHDNMIQFESFSFKTLTTKSRITNYFERFLILKQYTYCNNNFIAISADTFSYFKKNLPSVLNSNIQLQPNAINFKKFNAAAGFRNINEIRMVNTGSFVPKKNQIFLVAVLKSLVEKGKKASLTFLGEGPEMKNVKDSVLQHNLGDLVTFAGNVGNVEDYLKQANVYTHTAVYEPFGLVLLEAMAAGLPVVSLDGKGNRELVKDNWNGFFIEEQKVELFAEKIISLMSSEKNYMQMSTNAMEFSRGFDIKEYTNNLLSTYTSAII
jgi:glycosyltransferase involved in cell wall biosynthesis